MPKEIEDKLKKRAKKLVKSGKMKKAKMGAYVYGTMNKLKEQYGVDKDDNN